jgi:hypothetical protein
VTKGKITISWQKGRDDGTDMQSIDIKGDVLSHIEVQGILAAMLIANHNVCTKRGGLGDGTTSDSADESACDNG